MDCSPKQHWRSSTCSYQELPCVGDIDAARAEGAPLLHETPGRRAASFTMSRVSVKFSAAIFAIANGSSKVIRNQPSVRRDEIVEETFEFPMIYQYAMEPHIAVARVTADWHYALELVGASVFSSL